MSEEIKVNVKPLELKFKKMLESLGEKGRELLIKYQGELAKIALKYTPPKKQGTWSTGINKDDYYRFVYSIPMLLKDDQLVNHFNGKDPNMKVTSSVQKIRLILRQKIDEGYFFVVRKVVNHKAHLWFFKTIEEAEPYQKIKYRGYMKLMWGLKLMDQGLKASAFSKLLKSSPELEKFKDKNKLTFKIQKVMEGCVKFSVENVNEAINPSLNNFVTGMISKKGKGIMKKYSDQVSRLVLDQFNK